MAKTAAEPKKEQVKPQLTSEEKIEILHYQRQIFSLQITINEMKEKLRVLLPTLQGTIGTVLTRVNTDDQKYNLDMDSLELVPKQ